MGQIYYVQSGDSLWKISRRFGVTVQEISDANVLCNSDRTFAGQLLIIPDRMLNLPKAGGGPYYVVEPGDSLSCLHKQFNIPLAVLVANNRIKNRGLIYPEQELLLTNEVPNIQELNTKWEMVSAAHPDIPEFLINGLYVDTFAWEAAGKKAIPFLIGFLCHPCLEVRFYAAVSLGRIGHPQAVKPLQAMQNDPEEMIREAARTAIHRIQAIKQEPGKRIHVLLWDDFLLQIPNIDESYRVNIRKRTEVKVLRWFIPSPIGEEGPRGGLQYYDYVQVVESGLKGFLPRWGQGEINLI